MQRLGKEETLAGKLHVDEDFDCAFVAGALEFVGLHDLAEGEAVGDEGRGVDLAAGDHVQGLAGGGVAGVARGADGGAHGQVLVEVVLDGEGHHGGAGRAEAEQEAIAAGQGHGEVDAVGLAGGLDDDIGHAAVGQVGEG